MPGTNSFYLCSTAYKADRKRFGQSGRLRRPLLQAHRIEAIVAEDEEAAEAFLARVDSAILFWNGFPHFADVGEFGFGVAIGIESFPSLLSVITGSARA